MFSTSSQQTGQGFREERRSRARRADEEDVALGNLDIFLGICRFQALVVVVYSDGQDLLGLILPDYILVEDLVDFTRFWQLARGLPDSLLHLLSDNVITQLDALIADEDRGTGDELAHLVLALATERAVEEFAVIALAVIAATHLGIGLRKVRLDSAEARSPDKSTADLAFGPEQGSSEFRTGRLTDNELIRKPPPAFP